jgi:phospholipid/cholesterol/gamma-HCH transport system substrate-binding protein
VTRFDASHWNFGKNEVRFSLGPSSRPESPLPSAPASFGCGRLESAAYGGGFHPWFLTIGARLRSMAHLPYLPEPKEVTKTMAQRKELQWAQLRVGIMVTVGLIVLIVAIFFISGSVGFLTRKYTLRAYFSEAGGLREGAQVQLAGIPVGNVSAIQLSPFADPNRAVEVVMKVNRKYQDQIRADSEASTESAGLLGERFIDISRGSPGQSVVPDSGALKSHEERDIKEVVQNADDVISNLRVLSSKLNDVTNQITAGKGSLGKFIYDPDLYNRIDRTANVLTGMILDIQNGKGTIGKMYADQTLYDRLNSTVDRADQIMNTVEHGNGTMARFLNDPTVYDNMNKLVNKGNTLIDSMNNGNGTMAKLINDPQLYERLNHTVDNVDRITSRMEKGEGTLGLLSTDKRLYSNLSQSMQSLREFLTEFRQNPKKYLTIRVRLF